MICLRKVIVSFVLFAISAFALPVAAQNGKSYQLLNFPAWVDTSEPKVSTVTIYNTSPTGNSNFNSFRLVAPPGIKIVAAERSGTTYGSNIRLDLTSGKFVEVTNISPSVGRQVGFPLKLTLLGLECREGGLWVSTSSSPMTEVWSGQLSGQQFADTTTPPAKTIVGKGSSLAISVSPSPSQTSVVQGDTYTVTVNASSGCTDVAATGTVSLTAAQGTISGGGSKDISGGAATFSGVKFSSLGTVVLKASSTGYPDAILRLMSYAGDLACKGATDSDGNPLPFSFTENVGGATDIGQTGYAAGERGEFNKDGSPCIVVNYTFTNNVVGNASTSDGTTTDAKGNTIPKNGISFVWDTELQPGAAYMYTVTWRPEYVDATSGLPSRKARICTGSGAAACSSTVAAKACLSGSLPATLTTLQNPITSTSATSITVNTSATTQPTPFPIVIGKERMLVTTVSGTTWNVTRGNGGTTPATHLALDKVMSTPLPLDSLNKVMPACVVAETWETVPAGAPDCGIPDASGPRACVLPTTVFIDIGDPPIIRGDI